MKKYFILILFAGLMVTATSCLEDYLDKAPESGLTEEQVFSKYENFKKFFDAVYEGQKRYGSDWKDYNIKTAFPLYFAMWDQKYAWWQLTDMSDLGRYMEGQAIKGGQVASIINKFTYDGNRRPILESMFIVIRICNMSLQKIDMLKDVKPEDVDDFMAQAYFVRAFAHLELFRIWGPMPYIRQVVGPDDQWDIPRLSKYETLMNIAADMDTAVYYFEKANRMRRDNPNPTEPGHLNHPELFRPNGSAAKALKARVLLYAASPLNNEKGVKAWEEAAKANWEAIQTAQQWGYTLLDAKDYKYNYVGTRYSNEQLWGWSAGNKSYNSGDQAFLICGPMSANKNSFSGDCPTQNMVDKFETKWGDPLNTPAEREAAAALGHYNEQDPYKNRDPRFYIDIIYNTAPIPGYGTAKMYYEMKNGNASYSELLDQNYAGITRTGYYQRKRWGEQSVKNKIKPLITDPIIRLAELYLNYAEAANEAYGPNTPAPGASLTAVQAINLIRDRIGMAPVQDKFTASKEDFRPRIKNERTIELCFEGHYYQDIRRWMDAPQTMAGPLYGMDVEKLPSGYDKTQYPTGYKYTRILLPADRQTRWKDEMYYFPFDNDDMYKMKNFVPNPVW